ncbi:nucleoside kinase [Thermoanaerobacterium sp. DL9XJH110]|uniref:nucleoside kinase n=1 Tax=Thermoanaerobacterium sp. DL9XJH110 TaxID=3386643 RepID=UPI003BB58BD3
MKVTIDGRGEKLINEPVALLTLAKEYQKEYSSPIVGAIVNNRLRELTYVLKEDARLEFLDLTTEIGMKIYVRSLSFLFIKACHDVLPGCRVHIEHSLGDGLYCEIYRGEPISEEDVEDIESRMRQLVERDIPILKTKMSVEEAAIMFKKMGLEDKVRVLKYRKEPFVNIYELDGMKDYFYGYMLPSTGYLKWFKLKFYLPGVILQFPGRSNPTLVAPYREQPKLARVFREAERWAHILGVADVGALNDYIAAGRAGEIIRIAEALHEKKIAQIADTIYENRERMRIILIAGPSSSGKTTFAQRLMVQLRVNGLRPISVSLDDYFVDRDRTPLDEEGKPDFEALEAIDIKLFNQHLTRLIQGKEVLLPRYNFHTGKREYQNIPIRVDRDQPIIIEGIHGLNERLTLSIPKENKFKIYVSALTQLSLDNHNRISTTDTRLLRRIVRDSWSRSADARKTIAMWPSVLKGAEKNIFPYQEEADVMFNSALVYELAVLKKYAEPLLKQVRPEDPEYVTASYLLKFLAYFVPIEDEKDIPLTSIIREFIGGSCFYGD